MKHVHTVTVMWPDCDPARIVFHGNYFRWMDDAANMLFEEAGFGCKRMLDEFGIPGAPLVSAHGDFTSVAMLGDVIDIECYVSEFGNSSFTMTFVLRCGERVVAEGYQKRVWCKSDPDTGRLKTFRIPDDFRDALGTG